MTPSGRKSRARYISKWAELTPIRMFFSQQAGLSPWGWQHHTPAPEQKCSAGDFKVLLSSFSQQAQSISQSKLSSRSPGGFPSLYSPWAACACIMPSLALPGEWAHHGGNGLTVTARHAYNVTYNVQLYVCTYVSRQVDTTWVQVTVPLLH